jgi:phosphopantothenoylcysteine synthetase/decarboxylase
MINSKLATMLPFPKNFSPTSSVQQQQQQQPPKKSQIPVFSELLHMAMNGNTNDSLTKKRKERSDYDEERDNSDDDDDESENRNNDDDDDNDDEDDDKYHTKDFKNRHFLEKKIVITVRKYIFLLIIYGFICF